MIRYQKGDRAKKGYYLNLANGELVHLPFDGRILENVEGKVIRFPSLLAVLAAPFVGFAYVIFLPLTGIVAFFALVGLKIKGTARATRPVVHEKAR